MQDDWQLMTCIACMQGCSIITCMHYFVADPLVKHVLLNGSLLSMQAVVAAEGPSSSRDRKAIPSWLFPAHAPLSICMLSSKLILGA